jgi:two-component system response regulator NreC
MRADTMDSNNKIKILLANEHKVVREGLRLLFESQPDIKVLDEDDGKSIMQLSRELEPDIIVIDISMLKTDNLKLSRQILNENPGIGIAAHPERIYVHLLGRAIRAGITGFVLKECSFNELIRAVRAVYEKKTYMYPQIKDILAN